MSGYDQYFKKKAEAKKKNAPKPQKPQKLPQRKRTRKSFPVTPVIGAAVGLAVGLWAMLNVEKIDQLLEVVEVSAVTHSIAQTNGSEKDTPAKDGIVEDSADAAAAESAARMAAKESWTPEEIALFNKLDERKKELDIRESELNKLEEELQKQKSMLEARMQELEKTRRKIAGQLEDRVEVDQKRVNKLVDFYSNMKPANAAEIIDKLDEDLAVEVLGNMKKKSAADILNLLPPEKAQKLSEKYTGYTRR